jgi:hypothetical protein
MFVLVKYRRRPRARVGAGLLVGFTATLAACSGGSHSAQPVPPRSPAHSVPVPTTPITPTTKPAAVTSPDQLPAPTDAASTASELTRVERALRTDGADAATRLALGWAQQHAYGALSAHPEWADVVLAALPDDVKPIVLTNRDAAVRLSSPDLGAPPASLPDWTIRTPPPADVLIGYYREAESQSGIPWQYLAAVHFVETRMGRIHGNSAAGAQGPMQFIASTWAAYGNGGDVNNDHDAILAAGRFLADRGGRFDIDGALFAYNPSDAYVAAIKDYAGVIAADPRAYDGYYAWQVYVTTTAGTQRLPEGWQRP